jgi:hypothetical protein
MFYIQTDIHYVTLKANMLRFTPSLVLMLDGKTVRPYAKVGFVLGTGKVFEEIVATDMGTEVKLKGELSGNLAPGFAASMGTIFALSEKVQLFAEFNFISMSYAPNKGEVTEATANGVDYLGLLTTSEKEVEFVDSYFVSDVIAQDPNSPSKELKQYLPFSSVGLRAGVRINL